MIAQQFMNAIHKLLGFFLLKKNNGCELSMNNNDIIEKLTLGKEKTETVKIGDVEIELRPLTSGELAKLQSIEKQGFQMKVGVNQQGKRPTNDVDVNAGDFQKYQNKAMFQAVAWSMDIPEDAVEEFEVGIPEEIFGHVIRISSLSDEDLSSVKQFRKQE